MKRILSLWSVCCLVFIAAAVNGQTIFKDILRTPTYHDLEKIAYADTGTMYAIGDGATFLHTTSGGAALTAANVTTVSDNFEFLHGSDFASAAVGVVCGDQGMWAATTDGGTTWTRKYISGAGTLRDIKVDFSTGRAFAVEENGRIWFTGNLGATWSTPLDTQQDSTMDSRQKLLFSSRLAPSSYLVLADDGTLWQTTNTGQAWTKMTGTVGALNCSAMFFVDATHGWVSNNQSLYATTDGGQTWPIHATYLSSVPRTCIHFYDPLHGGAGYSTGSFGGVDARIQTSIDGGKTLRSDSLHTPLVGTGIVGIIAFQYGSPGVVWAVGASGDVRRSTDSGRAGSWKDLTQGILGPTRAMSFFDDNHGVYGSQTGLNSGSLFYTSNGGASWGQPKGAGENAYLVMRMTDNSSAVGMGPSSAQYTTNAGAQWPQCKAWPAHSNQFTRLFEVTPSIMYCVGSVSSNYGGVMASNDSGHTWIDRIPDANNQTTFSGLHFSSPTTGFVCGLAGFLLKTTDAGSTYSKIDVMTNEVPPQPTGDDFTDMAFSSPTNGWIIAAYGGETFRTTDAGASWNQVDIGATDTLLRVVFASDQLGWIGGCKGTLFQTTDGGTTWKRMKTGTSNPIQEICYTPRTATPTTLWLSGGKGMILRGSLVDVPVLVYPAGQASGVPTTLNASWSATNGATEYRVQVAADPVFESPIVNATSTSNTLHIQNLLPNTLYYWHVFAKTSPTDSVASTTGTFTTGVTAVNAGIEAPARISISLSPNPVGTSAAVQYFLPAASTIALKILDEAGNVVQTVRQGFGHVGVNEATINATELAAGNYFCRLDSERGTATARFTVVH